jgi:hypothetical protein
MLWIVTGLRETGASQSTPVKAKATKRGRTKKTRIVPRVGHSVLDQIEGVERHPEFQRCLRLWREIFRKQDAGLPLTPEEDAEMDTHVAPRTRFRLDAIAEADHGLLSQTKQLITSLSEAAWAFHSIRPPEIDELMKTVTVTLPLDLPNHDIHAYIDQAVENARKTLGVAGTQESRTTGVDHWKVYDMRHTEGLKPLKITHRLFGTKGSPAYDDYVMARYKRVLRAASLAERIMKELEQPAATKKNRR